MYSKTAVVQLIPFYRRGLPPSYILNLKLVPFVQSSISKILPCQHVINIKTFKIQLSSQISNTQYPQVASDNYAKYNKPILRLNFKIIEKLKQTLRI